MSFCPACGTRAVPGARFCDLCGQELDQPAAAPDAGQPERVVRLGQAEDNDVVLDYPMISAHHARVVVGPAGAVIEDLGSTNGTAVGRPDRKVQRSPLLPDDVVYLGSFRVGARRLLEGGEGPGRRPHTTLALSRDSVVIGRDPACDHVLEDPTVSRRHARLSRRGARLLVEDLGSVNGTFVNGERISARAVVGPGDTIALGSCTLTLAGGGLEKRDHRGNLALEARDVGVAVRGAPLLAGVSLTLHPGELVGLMGGSGAGKTTLLNALNGYCAPTAGRVLCNGEDLYASYAQFLGHIAFVPQDDILHGDLTVGQALYYSARLRLPADFSDEEIRRRIATVSRQLGLEGTHDRPIGSPERKGISGGQRKRVSLAMELLTDPSLLFLDEPTSGLSSEDALVVMRLLRDLADSGRTILLTVHQPGREAFRLLDALVVLSRDARGRAPGRLVYFGPAWPDSIRFFSPEAPGAAEGELAPEDLLRGLGRRGTDEWAARFAASAYKREYVDGRAARRETGDAAPLRPRLHRRPGLTQWVTLVRRLLARKRRDVWGSLVLLAQAPVVAGLVVLVFGGQARREMTPSTWPAGQAALSGALFLSVLSALWFGCSNAAREIVGEWAVYRRERMVNLKLPSYVLSKAAVLGLLSAGQCAVLVGVVHWGCGLRGPVAWLFPALLAAALVGVCLGLLVSSLARSSETAIGLTPLVLLPLVILGGLMQPLHEMDPALRALAQLTPSRWAFETVLLAESGARPPVGLPDLVGPASPGAAARVPLRSEDLAERQFPVASRLGLGRGLAVLLLQAAALLVVVGAMLRARDVH